MNSFAGQDLAVDFQVDVKTVAREISLGRLSAKLLIPNIPYIRELQAAAVENGSVLKLAGITFTCN